MTRLAQRSLVLVLFGASLLVVGCGGSSSPKDAGDGSVAKDVADAPKLDVIPDLTPIPPADGPVVTADLAADTFPVGIDSARTGGATGTDGSIGTGGATGTGGAAGAGGTTGAGGGTGAGGATGAAGDAAVDSPAVGLDAGPDAAADGLTDAAGDGAPADDSGAETDSLPVGCTFTGDNVTANLTLTKACSPYTITDTISVYGNAVLTIEAGVTLSFAAGIGISVGDATAGKLVAVGTAQDPIVFTSAAPTPAAGDWAYISFGDNTMAGTQIAYARLDYCGSEFACIISSDVKANRVTLDHLTIDHSGSDGILEDGAASNFAITNSSFSNIPTTPTMQYAISVQAPSFAGIGANNTFNGGAMIELAGGTVASTTSWSDPGTPIAVTTDNLYVDGPGSPVLTLGPGMTFKFDANFGLAVGLDVGGKLVAAGTAAKHVVLTSLATPPAPGNWFGVDVTDGSSAQLSYTDISYGGSEGLSGGNLILEGGNTTSKLLVDHSSFTYSLGYGIYLDCADTTSPPVATVTLDPSNTYGHNAVDTTNANDRAHNVGPGLDCPAH